MKVLVIKLTSMGDVLHLMPALTDLRAHLNEALQVDWMVEDSFAEIPTWHPTVRRVIPVATRRWRSFSWKNIKQFLACIKDLRADSYDVIIDAQGLMKSAGLGRLGRLNRGGKRIGFSADSIKESPAARFYQQKIEVPREQHAIERLRQLFAAGFAYEYSSAAPDYGLTTPKAGTAVSDRPSILFFHGTTWASKHLPDEYWHNLADIVTDDGYQVKLCWGNKKEKQRAEEIAQGRADVTVLPKLDLTALANELCHAAGAISVDTGLGHMAAAFGIPAVSVYGATDAKLTGAVGQSQVQLQTDYPCSPCLLKQCARLTEQVRQAPCYATLAPNEIWQQLYQIIV